MTALISDCKTSGAARPTPMKGRFIQHVISTFGITVVQQFAGLGRQILVAAYFGISRDYDHFLILYAVAVITVFNVAGVFDTVAVARLVKLRENEGPSVFWRTSNRLLLQACVGGVIFAIGLYVVVQLLLPVIAAGFDAKDQASLMQLALYFLPWIVIVIPYYAVCVHLKALWEFHWVFTAELVAIMVSAAVLWSWHVSIESLPIAYGVGYLIAFTIVLTRRGFHRTDSEVRPAGLLVGMANQHLANQLGMGAGLVDRYFQSYLESGGISALGYASLIVNNLSTLLTFKEIYVVPLSTEIGRNERLERMLKGIVLISIPCTVFVAEFALPLVAVLFQRGKFTAEAAELAGATLRIMAVSLAISTINAPMERMFQILNRTEYSYIRYFASLLGSALFQYLFVFRLGFGVYGVALATLASSTMVLSVVAVLVRRCGVVIDWSDVSAHALFAAAVAGGAAVISFPFIARFDGILVLALGGSLFGAFVALSYFVARGRLRPIIG